MVEALERVLLAGIALGSALRDYVERLHAQPHVKVVLGIFAFRGRLAEYHEVEWLHPEIRRILLD